MDRFPAPDPTPIAPDFEVPPEACDCQIHVYGPPETYPTVAAPKYEPHHELDIARVEAMHTVLGISRAVIVTPTVYGTDNRVTTDVLRAQPEKYRGVAVIGADTTDADLKAMDDAGFCAARFNFARFLGATPDADAFRRDVERIGALGWHAVLHVLGEDLLECEALFREVQIPVVVDHMAHLDLDDPKDTDALALLLDLLARDRWWIKLSNGDRMSKAGPPYDDVVEVGRTFVTALPERCLWGTDWPHVMYRKPAMANDGMLLNLLARYAPDAGIRNRILVDNPARLYGF